MNRSKIPAVAKAVYKALENSTSKEIDLYIKGNKYKVQEYEESPPEWAEDSFKGSDSLCIQFGEVRGIIPTVEYIEATLYKILF